MVGTALSAALKSRGATQLIYRSSRELDLRNQAATNDFFEAEQPEYVFLAAAKVGGIAVHRAERAEFLYDNLMIASNVIHASYKYGVKKLLFIGSSCIYPKDAQQPLREEYLLTAPLEPTNELYAIAKIIGVKLCETYRDQYGCNFISAIPTNLYGPGDNYQPERAHVLPALLRRIHEAKLNQEEEVEVWGTGQQKREFMHVEDLAKACLVLMESYEATAGVYPSFINVGVGRDLRISELARLIARVVDYKGILRFDDSRPDGPRRKLLNIRRLQRMHFRARVEFETGLRNVYEDFLNRTTDLE